MTKRDFTLVGCKPTRTGKLRHFDKTAPEALKLLAGSKLSGFSLMLSGVKLFQDTMMGGADSRPLPTSLASGCRSKRMVAQRVVNRSIGDGTTVRKAHRERTGVRSSQWTLIPWESALLRACEKHRRKESLLAEFPKIRNIKKIRANPPHLHQRAMRHWKIRDGTNHIQTRHQSFDACGLQTHKDWGLDWCFHAEGAEGKLSRRGFY